MSEENRNQLLFMSVCYFINMYNAQILIIIKHHEIFFFSNADQVAIGEEVLVQENNELSPVKVINISSHVMQGNFESSFELAYFSRVFSTCIKVDNAFILNMNNVIFFKMF